MHCARPLRDRLPTSLIDRTATASYTAHRSGGAPARASGLSCPGKHTRILLAADDRVRADGLCRSRRGAGYAIDHVAYGNDADSALARMENLRDAAPLDALDLALLTRAVVID